MYSRNILPLLFLSLWVLHARASVILQYHHISDDTPASTSTSPALFKKQMAYLHKHHFTVLPLPQLVSKLREQKPLADKTIALTFDDGYRSVFTRAYPVLVKYHFPFTVFINADPIDRGSKAFVSWDELKIMSQSGATIANHTSTHPHMLRLQKNATLAQWQQRMSDDIAHTQKAIETHIGQNNKLLAYPYGEYDAKVKQLLKMQGYIGLGQESGAVGPDSDLLALARFPMGGRYGAMDTFATKVHTLALPFSGKQLSLEGKKLNAPVLRQGQSPSLTLTLRKPAIAANIHCYLRGKKLPVSVHGAEVTVTATQGLPAGRSRYNCTARDAHSGRFYWFSQAWFVRHADGTW